MTKNHKTAKTKNNFSEKNSKASHHKAFGASSSNRSSKNQHSKKFESKQSDFSNSSKKNFENSQNKFTSNNRFSQNLSKNNDNFRQQNSRTNTSQNRGPKDQFLNANSNSLWLCGKHAVFTAIKANKRKIHQILVTPNITDELNKFLESSEKNSLKSLVKTVSRDDLDKIFPDQQSHQGIAINCSKTKIKNQFEFLSELHALPEGIKLPTLLLLDQIVDPQNVGAIIRSAVSFGIKDIIFCEHNSVIENSTVVKSSVGTIEFAELTVVSNFNNLMEKLKKIGYWCVGLCGEATNSIEEIKKFENVAIIVGSEGNGIRDLVKKNCDFLAKINIDPQVESLNASVACAITLYEISKLTKL